MSKHWLSIVFLLLFCAPTAGQSAEQAASLRVTPALVREIQFMLQTIGIDPGPIDGISRARTNNAVHMFEGRVGLPVSDVIDNGEVARLLVDRLREAALEHLKGPSPPALPSAPPAAVVAPPPPASPPDRFAGCHYDPKDFAIGGKQYTPQTFLDQGFDGSTDEAVDGLRKRLTEARQIAEENGGSALLEVQRQARVLGYFECRQKIETAGKN
jgi:peptidoglycan hydrolase-like protein with peptidoglycan-binding domain